eukprot:1187435-Prorocentrum_minimum.AAC.2
MTMPGLQRESDPRLRLPLGSPHRRGGADLAPSMLSRSQTVKSPSLAAGKKNYIRSSAPAFGALPPSRMTLRTVDDKPLKLHNTPFELKAQRSAEPILSPEPSRASVKEADQPQAAKSKWEQNSPEEVCMFNGTCC